MKTSHIKSIEFLEQYLMNSQEIFNLIRNRIEKVNGDFRQKEILASWQNELETKDQSFRFIKIKVDCTTGTYMRSLAEKIGEGALQISGVLSLPGGDWHA